MSDIKYNRIDEDLQQKIISNKENGTVSIILYSHQNFVEK